MFLFPFHSNFLKILTRLSDFTSSVSLIIPKSGYQYHNLKFSTMISIFAFSTFTPYPIAIYSIIYQSIITESPDLKVDLILISFISLILSFVDVYVSEQLNSWFSFYFPAHFIYGYFATLLCITSIMTFLGIQSSYSFLLTLHNRVLKGKTIHIRKMRLYSKTMKLHQCFTTRHLVCILELLVGHCMNDLFGVLNIREIQNNG